MSGTTGYRAGGVRRCCRELINRDGRTAVEGDGLECPWCYTILRFRDQAWEWVNPSDAFYAATARAARDTRDARTRDLKPLLQPKG